MRLRRVIAWWLDRAAERRIAHSHRIYRAHVDGKWNGGDCPLETWHAHGWFNYEANAGRTLHNAAEFLRKGPGR